MNNGHRKVFKGKNQPIQPNLISDIHVPICCEITILLEIIQILEQDLVCGNQFHKRFEGNVEDIGLHLSKERFTKKVIRTVVKM